MMVVGKKGNLITGQALFASDNVHVVCSQLVDQKINFRFESSAALGPSKILYVIIKDLINIAPSPTQ